MIVRNELEALAVAVEMERRAIRVYERALMLATNPEVARGIRAILRDEQEHLKCFTAMRNRHHEHEVADANLIKAMGAEMLFPGGVMEMERAEGLTTLVGLYRFATESEHDAMMNYLDFAARCDREEVRQAFVAIAREEASHLAGLKDTLEALEEEEARTAGQ